MNDPEKSGLRGAVRICETQYRCSPDQYKGEYVIREVFHSDGRRDHTLHEHANTIDWTHRWFYRDDKALIEENYDGTFSFRRTFKYDSRGRLDQVFRHGRHGRLREAAYWYHADGASTEIRYPDKSDGADAAAAIWADSMLEFSPDAVRIVTSRHRQDYPFERVFYDVDERPIQRVLFLYDDAGRLLEEGEAYWDDTVRNDFRALYRYDSQGRCIEKQITKPFHSERQATTYNEYGDAAEIRRTYLDTGIGLSPERPWACYFSYDYDAHHNWLICRIEHVRPTQAKRRTEMNGAGA